MQSRGRFLVLPVAVLAGLIMLVTPALAGEDNKGPNWEPFTVGQPAQLNDTSITGCFLWRDADTSLFHLRCRTADGQEPKPFRIRLKVNKAAEDLHKINLAAQENASNKKNKVTASFTAGTALKGFDVSLDKNVRAQWDLRFDNPDKKGKPRFEIKLLPSEIFIGANGDHPLKVPVVFSNPRD